MASTPVTPAPVSGVAVASNIFDPPEGPSYTFTSVPECVNLVASTYVNQGRQHFRFTLEVGLNLRGGGGGGPGLTTTSTTIAPELSRLRSTRYLYGFSPVSHLSLGTNHLHLGPADRGVHPHSYRKCPAAIEFDIRIKQLLFL